ncbi:MAG: fluoride efflux transporter CrcB [Chthoniobacterales bacterium]
MNQAVNLLLVGLGGFAGAVTRYLLGGWILHHASATKFPWSTFAVNVLGCLVIGLLSGVAERFDAIGPHARLFLFTGLLGGFTTFSAFGFETFFLLRRGEWLVAALYAGASVAVCVLAVWTGFRLIHSLPR